MLFHRGCCQNKSIASNMGWTAAYSIKGRGVWFRGTLSTPPPSASWLLGWPCAPVPPALWPVFRWDCGEGGWAVRPWRINQKALLVRVFSSMLCLCLPKCTWGLSADWVSWCVGAGGWCFNGSGCVSHMVLLLCWWFLETYLENVALVCSLHVNRLIR